MSTVAAARTVSSIIAGSLGSGGRRLESRNPARLDELVAEALLGDAATFVDAGRPRPTGSGCPLPCAAT
jgi:hypothetical protein